MLALRVADMLVETLLVGGGSAGALSGAQGDRTGGGTPLAGPLASTGALHRPVRRGLAWTFTTFGAAGGLLLTPLLGGGMGLLGLLRLLSLPRLTGGLRRMLLLRGLVGGRTLCRLVGGWPLLHCLVGGGSLRHGLTRRLALLLHCRVGPLHGLRLLRRPLLLHRLGTRLRRRGDARRDSTRF